MIIRKGSVVDVVRIKQEGVIEYLEEQVRLYEKMVLCSQVELEKAEKVGNELRVSLIRSNYDFRKRTLSGFVSELTHRMEVYRTMYGLSSREVVKGFDSDSFIKEMESIEGVEDSPLAYEDYEEEMEQITERDLKGDM